MSVVVVVEGSGGRPSSDSLGLLEAARPIAADLGIDLVALVVADAGDPVGLPADRVLRVDAASSPSSQALADALSAAARATDARYLLAAASILASDAAAIAAMRLEVGVIVDAVELHVEDGALVTRRAGLGDSVLAHCGFTGTRGVVIVRSGTYAPTGATGSPGVEALAFELSPQAGCSRVVGHEDAASEGPDIAEAETLVAGGRGLGSADGFRLAEELAALLGGAVASTRAVVDAGWYPYATQVGQTGKTVAPKLYIALGISGAVQHKVGMQGSGTVIAVNKDPHAPILEVADLAVVGDLHTIVPQLIDRLRER